MDKLTKVMYKNKMSEFGMVQHFLNQQKPKQCLQPYIANKDNKIYESTN